MTILFLILYLGFKDLIYLPIPRTYQLINYHLQLIFINIFIPIPMIS